MRPTVVRDLVTFARFACHNLLILSRVLTDEEKSGFNVMSGE